MLSAVADRGGLDEFVRRYGDNSSTVDGPSTLLKNEEKPPSSRGKQAGPLR